MVHSSLSCGTQQTLGVNQTPMLFKAFISYYEEKGHTGTHKHMKE